MTYAEAEKKVAELTIKENQAILDARRLEDEALALEEKAKAFRQRAADIAEQYRAIWQEVI